MTETTPVHTIHSEINAEDALTSLIRDGARKVLAAALETKVEEHIERFRSAVDTEGKRRVIRNGYLPEREIQTGAGKLPMGLSESRCKSHSLGC